MAVAGQRTTSSTSQTFPIAIQTFLATFARTTKTSGPEWVSVESQTYGPIFEVIDGRNQITGYEFTCTVVAEPLLTTPVNTYTAAFDIYVTNTIGTNRIGTINISIDVTAPEPEETISFTYEISPDQSTFSIGETFRITFTYSTDGDTTLSNMSVDGPSWVSSLQGTGNSRYVDCTPSNTVLGTYNISATAITSNGQTLTETVSVTIVAAIDHPEIPSFSITGIAGSSFDETLNVTLNGWSPIEFVLFPAFGGASEAFIVIDVDTSGTIIRTFGTIPSIGVPGQSWSRDYLYEFGPPSGRADLDDIALIGTTTVTVSEISIPSWTTSPSTSVNSGSPFSIDLTPDEGNIGDITYAITSQPNGVTGTLQGSTIVGTAPIVTADTNYTFGASATNSAGTGNINPVLTVKTGVGEPPTISPIPAITMEAGQRRFISLPDYTTGTEPITYSKDSGENWISLSPTNNIRITPLSSVSPGTYSAVFRAANSFGSDTATVTVIIGRITEPDDDGDDGVIAPSYTSTPSSTVASEGQFNIGLTPQRGTAPFTYSITSSPGFGTISGNRLTGSAPANTGTETVVRTWTLSVSNSANTANPLSVTVSLSILPAVTDDTDQPPNLQIPSAPLITILRGTTQIIDISSYVVSGTTPITYSVVTAPNWMTINETTGILTVSPPGSAAAGNYSASLRATNDEGSSTDTATITVSITPVIQPGQNTDPPSFRNIPDPFIRVIHGAIEHGSLFSYTFGGGTVVTSKVSGPSWVTVFGNGNVTAAPPRGIARVLYPVVINGISIYGFTSTTIRIGVFGGNVPASVPPSISGIPNVTVASGKAISIDVSSYINGNVTTRSVTVSPSISGLTFNDSNMIVGTAPSVTANTDYTITATVGNTHGNNSDSFTMTVRPLNLPFFLPVPASALEGDSRSSYSINMATYARNYTGLSFFETIPWASVSGTTLSGTMPYIATTNTWLFGVILTNGDGSASRNFTITGKTTDSPAFLTNAGLDAEVVEGDDFNRDFNRLVYLGTPPYTFTLSTGFTLTGTLLSWLTFENGILTGSASPYVSMDQTTPDIRITVTDAANRSASTDFTITILDGAGRERPRFTAIPEQVMIPGRSFLLPLISSPAQASDYLSGATPISIDQDEDEVQHAWLRVQPDGTGGYELIGNVPYDRTQTSDKEITVSLHAENQFGEDRVAFTGRIKAPSVGVPSFQHIGVLKRKEGTYTSLNPQIFLAGSPALVVLKSGSESESWFRVTTTGGYGGTTPTVPAGQDRIFQNNTFVAHNRAGSAEANFVFEIYKEATNFEWSSQISNITEYETEPVSYDVARFARANANNEFRFAAEQPRNTIAWSNLEISTAGLITSTAAPSVSKNETYSVTVEGRINTTDVWISSTFVITILNDVRGAVRWSVQIPHQRVNENTAWTFPTIGYVTGQTPISIGFTTGRNVPPNATITTRGVISFRNGRTPSVNRDTQFTFYLTANNYQGVLAKTFFEMTVLQVGDPVTGPSLNPMVTIERNANTPLNESIVSLMVVTSAGDLSFRKDSGIGDMLISRNGFLIGRTPNIRITTDYDLGMTVTDDNGSSTAILRVTVIGFAGQQQPTFSPFDLPDINEATDMYEDLNKYVRGADGTVIGLADEHDWLYVRAGILLGRAPNVFRDTPQRVRIQARNRFGTTIVTKNFTVIDVGSLTWDEGIGATRTVNRGDPFLLDCNDYLSGEKPHDIIFTPNRFYPTFLRMNAGIISGTCPANEPLGARRIFITGSNNHGRLETSFVLNIIDEGAPPTISGLPDIVRNEGSVIRIDTSGYTTGANITYSMSGHPSELSIDDSTGLITGRLAEVPTTKMYDISVGVRNDNGSTFDIFKLTNTDVPDGTPVWKQIEPIIVIEGRSISRELANYLEDSTEYPVDFFKTPGNVSPSWINVNITSGLMSGRAELVVGDTIQILYLTARNAKGQDSITVMVTIRDAITSGDPPSWKQIQDVNVDEGEMIRIPTNQKLVGQAIIGFNPNPVDADGNIIDWEPPDWLEISEDGTGLITGAAPFINKPQEIIPVYLIALNQSPSGNLQSASTSFNIINNDISGIRPEIIRVGIPEGYINGPFSITVDFNVDVTDVTLDSFDFTGVNIRPHTLYHGLTANSRGSVTQRNTVARYFSLRFPAPADGAIGNLNVLLKRHGVRIAVAAIGEG